MWKFIKDPPEFLRNSPNIRNDDVVTFFRLLPSVRSGSFRGFDNDPVWVTTGFKCSPNVPLFILRPFCLCGHGVSQSVLICACRFSAHLSVEASVFFNVYFKVQEGQTVHSDIFLCELDVLVHGIYMFCEGLHFPFSLTQVSCYISFAIFFLDLLINL